MDLELTEDQRVLRENARSFLAGACPPSLVRLAFEAKAGEGESPARDLWAQMIKLDWSALNVPEEFGGLGLGFVELALVAEETGRAVAPGPFMATATQFVPMVASAAGATASTERAEAFLRPVAEAGATGAVALAEPSGRWELEAVTTTARPDGSGWILDGTKSFVLDGVSAGEIAVVARQEGSAGRDGLGLFVMAGPEAGARPMDVIDPTQPLAELVLEAVAVPAERVLAEPGDPGSYDVLQRAVDEATIAMAAAVTGTCRAIFETTLQYTKDREQYGRPIGSFQALKHRLVNMFLACERASALVYFAALTVAEDDDRRSLAASMAKAAAGECQRLVVQDGLQMHGGIGYTWEHDLHIWLKRAKSGDFLYGSALTQRAAVAALIGVAS